MTATLGDLRRHFTAHSAAPVAGMLVVLAAGCSIAARLLVARPDSLASNIVVVVALGPMAMAMFVTLTARRPLGELTVTSGRSSHAWTLGVIAVIWTLAAFLIAASLWTSHAHTHGPTAAVRNLLGYVGMALIVTVVIDGTRAWIAPAAYGLTTTILAHSAGGQSVPLWAWPNRPDYDPSAWLIAAALAIAGVALLAEYGPGRVGGLADQS